MVMVVITAMETILQGVVTMVAHNPHHTTRVIILTDMKVMLHGEQVEMDHSIATEVHLDVLVW